MSESVFISGSITIKKLPNCVKESIDAICKSGMKILVGDATGIDTMVQDYCKQIGYDSVLVYSIYQTPRYKVSGFKSKFLDVQSDSKKERERQREKDSAMTLESDYSLVVWDGVSKGSYGNIIRALENGKKVKVFLKEVNSYLPQSKISKNEIEFVFRKNNGYTAAEVVEYLQNEGLEFFKNTRAFNKYLLENNIIKKEDGIYLPSDDFKNLFIIYKYHGVVKGIKFTDDFISWIEDRIRKNHPALL
jgi:hypothetical protein